MNTKQVKKVVAKNVKKAQAKGAQLKKVLNKNVKKAQVQGADLEAYAVKEYAKIRKQMDATAKKVEAYAKKNPEKVAAISAGVGLALGAIAGVLATHGKSTGKKKK